MEILYWILVSAVIIISFIGLIYPIIPSALFLLLAYLLYGFLFSFEPLTWLFWSIQLLFISLLFAADYLANYLGIKKYGGSKGAIVGSTIGLLVGPFIIPVFGIIIGPFIGAIVGEYVVNRKSLKETLKIGLGSIIGLFAGVGMKFVIQLAMVIYFIVVVL
ncbi:DUF456 domain-containing protein [Bacillus sp. Marseille-P3661]|uniref:DUF456 domain-containing protein n=1 Tax=Bacillus sp. Marseille-P3661 TaxID=1936234 RepID=UPI000C81BED9|nr:DUF456 domain-containing protein [Bacillus sp. Marseille-P3661]